ncbi:hypothetical protein QOZ80_1BG0079890 [Eleusine coracana subsp. coracana]|nr:hypothetical protein QOZ80_1BG0079890 [Eleusine coracana subsp. coracana]
MENGDETLASAAAPNGGAVEEEQVPATHAGKSYAAVVAENPAPNGGGVEEEEKVEAATNGAKSYAAVAARAEIQDLRTAKQELEEKLAEARRENQAIAAEAHRIEGIFMQAREEVTLAEDAAASSEKEAAELRAELERLQTVLKIEKGEHEMDKRKHEEITEEVEAVRQEKLKLEEEIKALKASAAAATTVKDRDASPEAEVPKEVEVAWQGMAAAAAVGAAVTAAVLLAYLRLKR